jgi:alpha-N-arabinofuranosidase
MTLEANNTLIINPQPTFTLSPYLYMQFMEPLGVTDGSVSAAWDFQRDSWRDDVVKATRILGPTMIRWGGCFSSYYRWKEGVGARDQRVPMLNLLWGGMESNQVGTGEFVRFCRQVGADPLLSVNFESDGRQKWAHPPKGGGRSAGPDEAAAWVDYCNSPGSALRLAHGVPEPYNVLFWQLGNETSYDPNGFDKETAAIRTLAFAEAMQRVDPRIRLIGWGEGDWVKPMMEIAGDHLSYLAFHNMFSAGSEHPASPLKGIEYRKDPAKTWAHLMNAYKWPARKIQMMRQQVEGYDIPLAITECHFSLPGRNRCEVLSTWAAGVANARILNLHEKNGDIVKIATVADFCGTRWQVNAVMIPVPGGEAYLMPVARVMSLYRHHTGENALTVLSSPSDLDVTASCTGDRLFLHIVNTNRTQDIHTIIRLKDMVLVEGTIYEITAEPEFEVMRGTASDLAPSEKTAPADGNIIIPAASVSAVEYRFSKGHHYQERI